MLRNPLILLARPIGLEPMTYGLEGRCSIHLSYERIRVCNLFHFQTAVTELTIFTFK